MRFTQSTLIPSGHVLLACEVNTETELGGVDAHCFVDPLETDFTQSRPIHTTFGDGLHRCMSSLPARTELRISLRNGCSAFLILKSRRMPTCMLGGHLPLVWKV